MSGCLPLLAAEQECMGEVGQEQEGKGNTVMLSNSTRMTIKSETREESRVRSTSSRVTMIMAVIILELAVFLFRMNQIRMILIQDLVAGHGVCYGGNTG